jgi:putative peptide-modifying radical SAM enzyme
MNEFENGLEEKWDFDFNAPSESEVDVSKLDNLLKDGDTLIFYGGEPLVNFSKMKEIIDFFENSDKKINFCMQTNVKLLKIAGYEYLKKLSKILVSIDGNKERTDFNRGKNTYDLVLKNLENLRASGYKGEIVARMTISFSDVYEQVKHILGLVEKGIFDSVHWQLDAGFYKTDFDFDKFSKFVEEYNESISKLVDFWVSEMESGKVLKFYPFLGLFENLYYDKKTKLMCGSGYANYTITTDGKIAACPIMNNVKNFYAGDLDSFESLDNLKKFNVGEPCTSCEYLDVCGGRCLYSNQAKLWPSEGEELICKTIIHLIESLKEKTPEIKKIISSGVVSEKDFEYEKYFGPEIIP